MLNVKWSFSFAELCVRNESFFPTEYKILDEFDSEEFHFMTVQTEISVNSEVC